MPPQATKSIWADSSPTMHDLSFLSAVTLNGVSSMPASIAGNLSGGSLSDDDEARRSQEEMTRLRVWLGVRSKEASRCMVAGHVVLPNLKNHRSMLRRSYVTPVDTVTGSSISSMEMGHRNS
jgi:hypothetical protein